MVVAGLNEDLENENNGISDSSAEWAALQREIEAAQKRGALLRQRAISLEADVADVFPPKSEPEKEAVTRLIFAFWESMGRDLNLTKRSKLSIFALTVFQELGEDINDEQLRKRLRRTRDRLFSADNSVDN
jgi:hypothetical protein